MKYSGSFQISAQKIDCWYMLEPPQRDGSNGSPHSYILAEVRKLMYMPVNPSYIVKKGVYWGVKTI